MVRWAAVRYLAVVSSREPFVGNNTGDWAGALSTKPQSANAGPDESWSHNTPVEGDTTADGCPCRPPRHIMPMAHMQTHANSVFIIVFIFTVYPENRHKCTTCRPLHGHPCLIIFKRIYRQGNA